MTTTPFPSTTVLYDAHIARGGKLIEFAGVMLPVWFSSLAAEHHAVRKDCGIFDISHMGLLVFTGKDAFNALQYLVSNDIISVEKGKIVYAMVLNHQGMVLDDVTVGKMGNEQYLLVVNAANKQKIVNWIQQELFQHSFVLQDWNLTHAFIAVQGPNASDVIKRALGVSVSEIGKFIIQPLSWKNVSGFISRTGYTGSDGFELIIPTNAVIDAWNALIEAGATPCGLGARDTLRIEAGLPLYGHELSESIHPLMTRYPWVVKWTKDFIGKSALSLLKEKPSFITVGLVTQEARAIPRQDYVIAEGGYVTSGTLSPSLEKPIGMAFVKPEYAQIGSTIHVEIRGKQVPATIVAVPFI